MLETKPVGTLKGGMDVDEVFLDPLGLAPENGFSGVGSAIDLSALKGEVPLRPAIAGDEDRIFQIEPPRRKQRGISVVIPA